MPVTVIEAGPCPVLQVNEAQAQLGYGRRKAQRTSVPQIWIGSSHVGGCDDLYALERAGKLDALLEA